MNEFLGMCRTLINSNKPLIVVMGNESCDLDSAVCAITLAYFFHNNSTARNKFCGSTNDVVPLLNIQRQDLPLKTETVYYLKELKIDPNSVLCRDDVQAARLSTIQFVLVDHHVSPFRDQTLFVVDHRPLDKQANLLENCQLIIDGVGSCATLVFGLIQKQYADDTQYLKNNYQCILMLLYGTIVLDTVNFSKEADKARTLDHEAVEKIECLLGINNAITFRTDLFNRLVAARADVSTLNALQMLSKDMKLVKNDQNDLVVAIPGYPVLVQDYVNLPNAAESVRTFGQTHNCDVIVLMGMKVTGGKVRRDSGIINIKNDVLFDEVLQSLQHTTLSLNLIEKDISFLDGKFFEARNVKPSRKQIMPVIKAIVDNFKKDR